MKKLEVLNNKFFNLKSLAKQLQVWRAKDKKIVFTNGCFDLLHRGHIDYLSKAADKGDILIIGLNSDSSIKKIKGRGRPITDEKSRSHILASLFFVDAVILFDEDTPYDLIKSILPDILVKGSDYKADEIVGNEILMASGGSIETIDFLAGYSTTQIINKIKEEE